MEKFILVIDAADDAAMFPVSGLRAVTCAADATVFCSLLLGFMIQQVLMLILI